MGSGGGFSAVHSRPSWQSAAVSSYFAEASTSGLVPVDGYTVDGRGYPDVALAGFKYAPEANRGAYRTSASALMVAEMFANINSARMASGKGSIGWANPALYANAASFNDITAGDNKAVRFRPACTEGFHAGKGWDPVSGLGSINYDKLETAFLALGSAGSRSRGGAGSDLILTRNLASHKFMIETDTTNPTVMPTFQPSSWPSSQPTYTAEPTLQPASTSHPSAPTSSPSMTPTSAPTSSPSVMPTFQPSS